MIIRIILPTIVILICSTGSLHAQESSDLAKAAAARRALLRDSSDLGIGLSLGRYRNISLPHSKATRGPVDPKYYDRMMAMRHLDFYGLGLPRSWSNNLVRPINFHFSPLYNWHAPVVQQHGNHWIIRPGHFHEYPTGGLWVP